jgi:TonB family protein
MTQSLCSLGLATLCLLVAPTLGAQAIPVQESPSPGKGGWRPTLERKPPARYAKIDQLLRSADWVAAEQEARAAIAEELAEKESYLGPLVTELAVAEAEQGRYEDAFWHWQLARGMGWTADVSHYGAAGERLTRSFPRALDQAPSGLEVRREGDGGPFTPARKLSGEDAKLPGTFRSFPRGIRVQVIVDREGRAEQPVVAASTFPALTYVVLEAVRAWRFKPAEAGGKPVASFYELEIPARQPLDQLADFGRSPLAQPLAMLKAGRYAEALKSVERIWKGALNDAEQTRAFMGVALTLKALAEAGLGREDSAICRFQAAQTLEPRLFGADLTAFGPPGALLTRHPWVAPGLSDRDLSLALLAATDREKLTKPEILTRRTPVFPDYARRLGIEGRVVVSTILTEMGVLRDVVLWQPSPSGGFDAGVLDTVCDWRFRPATWKGKPVTVQYSLTVNFEIRPHS